MSLITINRPRVKIERDFFDWFTDIIGAVVVLSTLIITYYYYPELPETIPTHFNAAGEPDGFGDKSTLWTLPIVSACIYLGLFILNFYPHLFNLPVTITLENATRQYKLASKMMRVTSLIITFIFLYICYGSIQVALLQQESLGTWSLFVSLGILLGAIGYYIFRMQKAK